MKFLSIFFFTIALVLTSCKKVSYKEPSKSTRITHKQWDELLKKYVDEEGRVNYKGFVADSNALNQYLNLLSSNPPEKGAPTKYSMAYWINAYNAFTVKLIVQNYPVESIQDLHPTVKIPGLSTVWHKKFFKIGDYEMSLDYIEHKILRVKYDEPRIHFAINCASRSCPKLLNEAFTADQLEKQLTAQTKDFLADDFRNKITADEIQLSRIFQWFKGDFTKNGSLIDFLNKYSRVQINPDANQSYLKYDWSLNE